MHLVPQRKGENMLEFALTSPLNTTPISPANILAKVYSFILSWPDPRKQDSEHEDVVSDEGSSDTVKKISEHRVRED